MQCAKIIFAQETYISIHLNFNKRKYDIETHPLQNLEVLSLDVDTKEPS